MRKLFEDRGVHCLVDGQFGSTGKGALAAWLAEQAFERGEHFWGVISNAGPNSGHTFYHNGQKVVLKQLPTFAVKSYMIDRRVPMHVFMTAGAIIDLEILAREADLIPGWIITVHPQAVVVTEQDKTMEHSGTVAAVAGTRTGTGMALARKVLRDPRAVMGAQNWGPDHPHYRKNIVVDDIVIDHRHERYFMEVSQGFSLGLHSQFYPKVTSRECTVSQGFADARLPPQALAKTYMVIRTYPIRVGNVDGFSSGDWYHDQKEIGWEDLGVEAERTTVTQRIRRVATFSVMQYKLALMANQPDWVFANFLNYFKEVDDEYKFLDNLRETAMQVGSNPGLILGRGPASSDIDLPLNEWHES